MLILGSARASWYPASYYIQPHYATMPEYLRIEDAITDQLEGKRKRFWERCRDSGLGEWAPLGIELRMRPAHHPYAANRVTFNFFDKAEYGSDRTALHCFEVCPPLDGTVPGADWIHIDRTKFEQTFLSRVTAQLKYLVAHEFGHSLGFGHGGDGIMDETPDHAVVNDEELEAARAYWFPA